MTRLARVFRIQYIISNIRMYGKWHIAHVMKSQDCPDFLCSCRQTGWHPMKESFCGKRGQTKTPGLVTYQWLKYRSRDMRPKQMAYESLLMRSYVWFHAQSVPRGLLSLMMWQCKWNALGLGTQVLQQMCDSHHVFCKAHRKNNKRIDYNKSQAWKNRRFMLRLRA